MLEHYFICLSGLRFEFKFIWIYLDLVWLEKKKGIEKEKEKENGKPVQHSSPAQSSAAQLPFSFPATAGPIPRSGPVQLAAPFPLSPRLTSGTHLSGSPPSSRRTRAEPEFIPSARRRGILSPHTKAQTPPLSARSLCPDPYPSHSHNPRPQTLGRFATDLAAAS